MYASDPASCAVCCSTVTTKSISSPSSRFGMPGSLTGPRAVHGDPVGGQVIHECLANQGVSVRPGGHECLADPPGCFRRSEAVFGGPPVVIPIDITTCSNSPRLWKTPLLASMSVSDQYRPAYGR